jgi:hypothetical protein
VTIITLALSMLLTGVLTGWTGFHPTWYGHAHRDRGAHHERHARHEGRSKVMVAAHEDGHGTLKVRTHRGQTHVKLGAGRHGLEVWTDEGGKARVDLGGALKVETDEKGGSKVRLGDLAVDTAGSD